MRRVVLKQARSGDVSAAVAAIEAGETVIFEFESMGAAIRHLRRPIWNRGGDGFKAVQRGREVWVSRS